ncbi:hypothetical protein [Stenotrophomonas sp. 24(2023)]|uniref:hypothetical protein n=1 Tax=Stenotrophomonas sp. 24(2023) TaxID=3068324 RepID=UPI0027DEB1B4|nr:hypothetical protein [Stenotrophomonas sp. 24(2023)]WMJ71052.1 hypothetical protein Q9R17_08170 [Stenotrophomonas sp. 24(2023)]
MARRARLRLWLSDDDAHQVRQWLAPVLALRRQQAAERRRRRRRRLLTTLWLLVFAIALLTRYL